jgi:hypothetical protein
MGLHNIILSETTLEVEAIIDWEFCAAVLYISLHPIIERFFRKLAMNGFGPEYPRADELRHAFWGAIPEWQTWNTSEATIVFLEWFHFVRFMKAEYRPHDLSDDDKANYWAENVQVVESFLAKYQ